MNRLWFGLSALLVAALSAGCGDNGGGSGGSSGSAGTAGMSSGGSGGSTGGSNTGGSMAGSGGSTGGSNTGGSMAGSGGSTGGSNTGGSGGGTMCGGIAGMQCAANQLCDYPDDSCGAFDSTGICIPRPDVCPDNVDPVCACDGKVYNNACEAQAAGTDVGSLGGCPAPAGQFPCGPKFCAVGQQYCQVDVSDVAGVPNTYGCMPLPAPCSQPNATCDCLANVPCGSMCKQADGGFTVTCPGG